MKKTIGGIKVNAWNEYIDGPIKIPAKNASNRQPTQRQNLKRQDAKKPKCSDLAGIWKGLPKKVLKEIEKASDRDIDP